MPVQLPQQEKESSIDQLLKGLQVAASVYGIAVNHKTLDEYKNKKQKQSELDAGTVTEDDLTELNKNYDLRPTGIADPVPTGARKFFNKNTNSYIMGTLRRPERSPYEDSNAESTLRKEYEDLGVTKNSRILGQAYRKIKQGGDQGSNATAATDIGIIFNFMKMNDPSSTVREGEYATAQNAGSIPERIRGAYNQAVDGQKLDDDVRINFVNEARNLLKAQLEVQSDINRRYGQIAGSYKMNPSRVVDSDFDKLLSAFDKTPPLVAPPPKERPNFGGPKQPSEQKELSTLEKLQLKAKAGDKDAAAYLKSLSPQGGR